MQMRSPASHLCLRANALYRAMICPTGGITLPEAEIPEEWYWPHFLGKNLDSGVQLMLAEQLITPDNCVKAEWCTQKAEINARCMHSYTLRWTVRIMLMTSRRNMHTRRIAQLLREPFVFSGAFSCSVFPEYNHFWRSPVTLTCHTSPSVLDNLHQREGEEGKKKNTIETIKSASAVWKHAPGH